MEQLNNPTIELTFETNDLASGHSTSQTLGSRDIVFHSFAFTSQLLNGLKSSSDQVALQLNKGCTAIGDIIATEGNIKAVLKENGTTIFTGYISTNFTWSVTVFGEEALNITIESVGTRLLAKYYLETGKEFIESTASSAIYAIARKAGITTDSTNLSALTMDVMKVIEAGKTCRDLLDQLCYEIGYVYYFNANGVLLVKKIEANTDSATLIDSDSLYSYGGAAISLSKSLRTYKSARVSYMDMGKADDYLVYRNTTGQNDNFRYCKLEIPANKYFDGVDFYTTQEWQTATSDEFHEPALISACNAESESSKVGSGNIVAIKNLRPEVNQGVGTIEASFSHYGGNQFTLTAHNTSAYEGYLMRLDLYASIVYEKSKSIIRTSPEGATGAVFEETLEWIHSKEEAQKHANLVAQYNKNSGSKYSFYSLKNLELGQVIRLNDNVHSNLNVYALLVAKKWTDAQGIAQYTAVGISTFALDRSVYTQTTDETRPTTPQGARGEDGASAVVEYAVSTNPDVPPSSEMYWSTNEICWDGVEGAWEANSYSSEVPTPNRGEYVWMRTRTGNEPWQYTRLTGSTLYDADYFGIIDTTSGNPTQTPDGRNLLVGDSFVDSSTHAIKVYTGNGNWASLSQSGLSTAKQGEVCAKAQKDVLTYIAPESVTESDYGYFNNVVAGTVTADFISGIDGEFENLHIGDSSTFDGDITSDAFETRQTIPTQSLVINATLMDCTKSDGSTIQKLCFAWDNEEYYGVFTQGSFCGMTLSENAYVRVAMSSTTEGSKIVFSTKFSAPYNNIVAYSSALAEGITPPQGYCYISKTLGTGFSTNMASNSNTPCCRTDLIIPKTSEGVVGSVSNPFKDIFFGQCSQTTHGYANIGNGLKIEWGVTAMPTGSTFPRTSVSLSFVTSPLVAFASFAGSPNSQSNYQHCGADIESSTLTPQIDLWAVTGGSSTRASLSWLVIGT